ncbi:SDR family oxidoreductase [Sphingomonas sp. MMS24-J13]|uniref:SDR family oxidoreductase n=1 Tax=Sphingomonas sp. MMS24-J13 TaxID=3238686 RepID=UPI00384AAFFE
MTLALVTGGLSKLGAVIAARLANAGYDLALHMRTDCEPEGDLAAAIARNGARWEVFPADLSDSVAIGSLINRVTAHFGRAPTLLVNSASMLSEGGWGEVSLDELVTHFRVNAAVPLILAQQFAAALQPDGRGAIVNILDQRITNPPPDQAAYTLSKLTLAAATRSLARAFAPSVRVNAVAPGLTIPGPEYSADQAGRLAALMPLGRLPKAVEVADTVAFLASAEAVTGQIIFVDGGASLESYPRDFAYMER